MKLLFFFNMYQNSGDIYGIYNYINNWGASYYSCVLLIFPAPSSTPNAETLTLNK